MFKNITQNVWLRKRLLVLSRKLGWVCFSVLFCWVFCLLGFVLGFSSPADIVVIVLYAVTDYLLITAR